MSQAPDLKLGVRILNPSLKNPRTNQLVPIYVPTKRIEAINREGHAHLKIGESETPVFVVESRGEITRVDGFVASIGPGEALNAEIVSGPQIPAVDYYSASPWLIDEPANVGPEVWVISEDGTTIEGFEAKKLTQLLDTNTVKRWGVRGINPDGFVLRFNIEIPSGMDSAPWEMHLAWSDRSDTGLKKKVGGIFLSFGEYPEVNYRRALGIGEPFEFMGRWWVALSGPREFADGNGFEVTGRLLGKPDKPSSVGDPQAMAHRLTNHSADMEGRGPVVGMSKWWPDGSILGLPRPQRVHGFGSFSAERERFFGEVIHATHGDLWAPRPRGPAMVAGQAGDQPGFGYGDVARIFAADPSALFEMRFSVSEACRPIHHLTNDDELRVIEWDRDTDQRWLTWSQTTHGRGLPSSERGPGLATLGKDFLDPANFWGVKSPFTGKDDQHQAMIPLAECAAFPGMPLLAEYVHSEAEADLATYRDRVANPRAVGRSLHTRCHRWRILKGLGENIKAAQFLEGTIIDKVEAVRDRSKLTEMDRLYPSEDDVIERPVRPLVVQNPDPRVLGGKHRFVSPWMEAFGAKGLFHAATVLRDDGSNVEAILARDLCISIARSVIEGGIFFDAARGKWRLCYVVAWLDDFEAAGVSDPLDEGSFSNTFFAPAPETPKDAHEYHDSAPAVEVDVAERMSRFLLKDQGDAPEAAPGDRPDEGKVLPVSAVYEGSEFAQPSADLGDSDWSGWTGNAILAFLSVAPVGDPSLLVASNQCLHLLNADGSIRTAYQERHLSGYRTDALVERACAIRDGKTDPGPIETF